jgi:transglutaminase-like putative cysteine protease
MIVRGARELLLTGLTTATTLAAIGSWSRITDGLGHAMPTIVWTGVAVALIGVVARIALPTASLATRLGTLVLQLAAAWCIVSVRIAHHPIPLRYAPRMRLENAFVAAGNAIAHSAPPVPVIGGVLPLVLCGAGAAFVLSDLLARTLRLPAIAGLVLLAVVAVPISVVGSDVGITGAARRGIDWWLFALVALGWLAQVVLAEGDRLSRWGRSVDDDRGLPGDGSHLRSWAGTAAVGGTATVLALVVPLGLPATRADFSGWGQGGSDNGKVTVTNPMVDVRQNLVQGADVPLVTAWTADPDPSYLRIAVLTRFSSTQWSAGDRSIPKEHDALGAVPIAGLFGGATGAPYPYRISVSPDFASRWLPTPAPIDEIDADGDWRYDSSTDDFIAASKDLTTAGMTYTARRVRPDLTAAELADMPAGVGEVSSTYTSVPSDLPPIVAEDARRFTRGATTPFEQAVALQDWFSRSGEFRYSTSVTLGSSGADLATFLGDGPNGHAGYCQQFSAAMAAMARTLGIPSRVAVGFLNPTRQDDGSYVYSSHDMHAWPELYFAGAGWVMFEPTPAQAGTSLPSYAHRVGTTTDPTTGPSASASTSTSPRQVQTRRPDLDPEQETSSAGTSANHHVLRWLGVLLLVGLALALLALPAVVRRRRRRARLEEATPGAGIRPEDAWAELRDTALDLRIPWPEGLSPRDTRDRLQHFVVNGPGHRALGALTDAVERERYALTGTTVSSQVLLDVIAGLEDGETPGSLRRAHWWPRSVIDRRRATTPAYVELDRVG